MSTKPGASWSQPADLKQQVQRLWDSGKLLRGVINRRSAESAILEFPYRLRSKKPSSKELSGSFDAVRQWIAVLNNLQDVRIEWRDIRHPQLGANRIPKDIWLDSLNDALALIGKRKEAQRFISLVERLMEHDPRLIGWVEKHPLNVLMLQADWERLLRLHAHMCKHPDAGIYLRQISVPGVDTKFIEKHRKVLSEWLNLSLPAQYINDSYQGVSEFAARYGYRVKPIRYRLRSLDKQKPLLEVTNGSLTLNRSAPNHAILNSSTPNSSTLSSADMAFDVEVLAALNPQHASVLIVENEITYLSLPEIPNTLAIFGGGYGFKNLDVIQWLHRCDIFYWGDIDRDGFAILNQLRAQLPTVYSVLMDRETLLRHSALYGTDSGSKARELSRLSGDELALYQELLENRLGDQIRLEQEQIDFNYACDVLRRSLGRNVI